ncbi:MAG: NADPH:quinone oxidoreductase family protein [Actinomycetota bacterium]|jgi:NADPH:quinone reductase|nr:NADPH:quinone oxidoreductase family protein [Actinomycetota bacterium]
MRAVRVTRFGGPEVLEVVDDAPEPVIGAGMALLDVDRAGINFADTHQAEDTYLAPTTLPFIPGVEAAGRIGGRRVVALLAGGGYAERAAAPLATTFDVPDGVDDGTACALVLQGTTAWHILRTSARIQPGETVVVMAAAGGVGTLAVQLARTFGAGRVVAVASSPEKRALAAELGADATVDSGEQDLTAAIREACGGRSDVVLEMTGGPTTAACLATLAPFGRLVMYGMASRQPTPPVDLGALTVRSQGVIGFWLVHAMRDPARLLAGPMAELLDLVARGELRAVIGDTYALGDARRAHEDLRARRTVGKLLLDPAR